MSPRARALIIQVAREHGLTMADLVGRSTLRAVAHARFQAMASVRSLTTPSGETVYSFPAVGRMFGRDHTTAMSAIRRAKELGLGLAVPFDDAVKASALEALSTGFI